MFSQGYACCIELSDVPVHDPGDIPPVSIELALVSDVCGSVEDIGGVVHDDLDVGGFLQLPKFCHALTGAHHTSGFGLRNLPGFVGRQNRMTPAVVRRWLVGRIHDVVPGCLFVQSRLVHMP